MKHIYAINDTTTLQLVSGLWQLIHTEDPSVEEAAPFSQIDLNDDAFTFFEDSFNAFPLVGSEAIDDCYALRTFCESAWNEHCLEE